MTNDVPDWNTPDWKVEATQRPNLIFPTGRVIFFDDFEDPTLRWQDSSGGTGSIAQDTSYARMGASSLKLTAAAVATNYGGATLELGLSKSKLLGLECFFTVKDAFLYYLEFDISRYTTSTYSFAYVRLDKQNNKWQYDPGGNNWTDITGGSQKLRNGSYAWHQFKISMDFDAGKYITFNCNDLELDISDLTLSTGTGDFSEYVVVDIYAIAGATTASEAHVDRVSLTEEG